MKRSVPTRVVMPRLIATPPTEEDAREVFERYASDPAVTRYMSWSTHQHIDETYAYVEFCQAQWRDYGHGGYLLRDEQGRLVGGTGLDPAEGNSVSTGYVLATDCWGYGYATECLKGMIETARNAGFDRVEANVHVDHQASMHVLRKGGMREEGRDEEYAVFPNLDPERKLPALIFALDLRA